MGMKPKPPGFGKFDKLMKKLVKVPPAELPKAKPKPKHARGCPARYGGSCFCKK